MNNMSDRKIENVIGLLRKAGLRNEHTNPEEIYEGMREYSLFELAEEFSQFINLIYDIREVLEEGALEIKESDILEVTLLSTEEARELPKELLKADEHWWLRSPGGSDIEAAFVHGDGGIVFVGGIGVDREYGVRPALKLKSLLFKKGDSFSYNGYEWDVIGDNLALCRTIVGECAFRKCLKADDANNYETSDIKKWLNDWWKDGEKVRNEK